MINYKKTYTESTSWRHWRLSCLVLMQVHERTAATRGTCFEFYSTTRTIYKIILAQQGYIWSIHAQYNLTWYLYIATSY